MEILSPRWGGSYDAMDAFARDAQSHVARNRRLEALLASSLAERAFERCCTEHNLPAALATYDSAVAVAPEREFLLARGRVRGQLRDYLGALADFNAAWQQRPQGPRTLDARAKTYLTIAAFASPEQMGKLLDLAQADVGVLTAVTNEMPAALEEAQTLAEARAWHARVHGH
jgi:tetratricopeptide (TPR) repeat protein